MAQGKGSKTNPTRDRGGDVAATRTTGTPCDHCGELIPAGQVITVKRMAINAAGGSRTRTYRFTKGHSTEPRVA